MGPLTLDNRTLNNPPMVGGWCSAWAVGAGCAGVRRVWRWRTRGVASELPVWHDVHAVRGWGPGGGTGSSAWWLPRAAVALHSRPGETLTSLAGREGVLWWVAGLRPWCGAWSGSGVRGKALGCAVS